MKKVLSVICAAILFLNGLLHSSLVFGAPLGEYVLGGEYVVFPLKMRLVSMVFALLWSFFGVLYLQMGAVVSTRVKSRLMTVCILVCTLFFVYAIFGNLFFTQSIKEKILMTPLAVIMSICSTSLLFLHTREKCKKMSGR